MDGQKRPATQIVKASEARQRWSELINEVFRKETRVLVEKSGIPVAAIVSADDLQQLQHLQAEREADSNAIHALRAAFQDVPDEELEREVNRAYAQARERYRRSAPAAVAKTP